MNLRLKSFKRYSYVLECRQNKNIKGKSIIIVIKIVNIENTKMRPEFKDYVLTKTLVL